MWFKVKKKTYFSTYCTLLLLLYALPFWNAQIFIKAHRSEKRGVLWLASYPVCCDWSDTSSVRWKCVLARRDKNNKPLYKQFWIWLLLVAIVSFELSLRLMLGLMDRALDLKPEVTQRLWVRIPGPAGSVHDWGETLEQGTEPPTAPRALHSRLPTAPLGWVKCREHISLLIIHCIVVYVTNKAHLSWICICLLYWLCG